MIHYANIIYLCICMFQRYVATPPTARHVCWKVWKCTQNIKKSEKTLDIWYHSSTQVPCEYLSAADMQRIPNCNKGSPCRMVCNQARILQRPCILVQWHTDSKNWRCPPRTGLTRWDPGPFTLTISHGTWKRFPWVTKQQQSEVKPCMSSHVFLPEEHWRFWQPFCLGTCFQGCKKCHKWSLMFHCIFTVYSTIIA